MSGSYYWYDLETSGTDPKWDRIVQFAGMRTDADLNITGDEYCEYVVLPDDVLPSPEATLVTGITPQLTHRKGIAEARALVRIQELFSQPNTCVAGYNSLRFDDEFIRYAFYRNMLDPYAREWQQGNSRWDIIDLVRATGALRREGINWPTDEDGLPVYRLEILTQANGIEHGHAHDALSDVRATIGMAKLIKQEQPRLFEYYFSIRSKKKIRQLLEPYGARMLVHVSGMYPRDRFGVAPIMSVAPHPTNSNSVIVVDLASDIEMLLSESVDTLRENLFTKDSPMRPPLKEIRLNRCPFIAQVEVLSQENIERVGLDMKQIKERARRLRQPGLAEKISRIYKQPGLAPNRDPDAALYDAFLNEQDKSRAADLLERMFKGHWQDMDFSDKRMSELAWRMKVRSFNNLIEDEDLHRWRDFVVTKLEGEGDWMNLARFQQRLELMMLDIAGDASADESQTQQRVALLRSLSEHAVDLRSRYGM